MFLIRAARIGRGADGGLAGLGQVVAEQVVFDFLAGDVRQHHAVDLHAGGKRLSGLPDHLGVVLAVVDDVDVSIFQAVLAQNGADAVGPSARRLEVCFDVRDWNVVVRGNGAR